MVKRGEIWWASLPDPRGSERGYRRPVVIVQSDAFNESAIHTVIAAVITSNLRLASAPGNVALRRRESGLSKDSVVNLSQLVTLDKSFLSDRVGRLSSLRLREMDDALRVLLSL